MTLFGATRLCAVLLFLYAATAPAQIYPVKPIQLIVGAGPGSVEDFVAREIAPAITTDLRQPVTVENRTGAGGLVAAEHVAEANPDGHTLLVASPDTLAVRTKPNSMARFNPLVDFAPIGNVAVLIHVLVVDPRFARTETVKEFVALAKKRGGQLRYASEGSGTLSHLGALLLNRMAGIDATHIPHKGSAWALPDLLAGRIQYMITEEAGVRAMARAGRLRILASTGTRRTAALPELPTLHESGFPGYDILSWQGVFAPGKTSSDILAVINAPIVRHLKSAQVVKRLLARGLEPVGSPPEAFRKRLKEESPRWAKLIQLAKYESEPWQVP